MCALIERFQMDSRLRSRHISLFLHNRKSCVFGMCPPGNGMLARQAAIYDEIDRSTRNYLGFKSVPSIVRALS